MNIGDKEAKEGMTNAIYKAMEVVLSPSVVQSITEKQLEDMAEYDEKYKDMQPDEIKQKLIDNVRPDWKNLSFAIAQGVINHLQSHPKTELDYAETFTSATEDEAFWSWFSGFTSKLKMWATDPTTDIVALKESLKKIFEEHPAPGSLKGIIR